MPSSRLRSVMARGRRCLREEAGVVATEYGLILLLISLTIVVAATAFGVSVSDLFDQGTAGFPSGGGS